MLVRPRRLASRSLPWGIQCNRRGRTAAVEALKQVMRALERVKGAGLDPGESSFQVIKNLFVDKKMRDKGLAKNTAACCFLSSTNWLVK